MKKPKKKRTRIDYRKIHLNNGCPATIETKWGKAYLKPNGYYQVSMKIDGKWKYKSIHLLIWNEANGSIPNGVQIHHKDHNTTNNQLSNLEAVSIVDHRREHCGWVKTNNEWSHKPCMSCKKTLPLSCFYKDNYRKKNIRKIKDDSITYEPRCIDCCRKRALEGFYAKKNTKALHTTLGAN